jgi:23S rRNA (pseudouridine1915-N3)-methyltransferase
MGIAIAVVRVYIIDITLLIEKPRFSGFHMCYGIMDNWEPIFQKQAPVSIRELHRDCMLLSMQITLAHIGSRSTGRDEFNALTKLYLERASAFVSCDSSSFRKQEDLFEWLSRKPGRTVPLAVLLDSHGRQLTSEEFAAWIGARRDDGARHIVFAIGPADGWSTESRRRAQLLLSLGSLTMAHALARLVMAEQLYRACTILAGHPYHTGH